MLIKVWICVGQWCTTFGLR